MDTPLINPGVTAIFGVLGMIGSALIHLAKLLLPGFQVKFDTVWDDRMRQAFTFWVGIIVVVIGSALMLAWRYASGEFPADPRDALLFGMAQVVQFVTNLASYIAGNNTFFNQTKHLLTKREPAPQPAVVRKVDYQSPAIERRAAAESRPVDIRRLTREMDGVDGYVTVVADDTLRGGGAQ